MISILVPFKQVGDFRLKTNINNYLPFYPFSIAQSENTNSISYSIDNPEITIWTKMGIIETIGCYDELFYLGQNLIGLHIESFIMLTREAYFGEIDELDFEEDSNIPQKVYEFENIGLQVWTKNDIIVSIIVNTEPTEDFE